MGEASKPESQLTPSQTIALDRELAEIAVRLHLLSAPQVAAAFQAHTAETLVADYTPGLIFVQKGLLDRKQLEYVATVHHFKEVRIADKRFGELAVARGWATDVQVNAAMEVQKLLFLKERKEVPIGEMLVRQRAITADQRDILLQIQQRARQTDSQAPAATRSEKPAVVKPAAAPAAVLPQSAAETVADATTLPPAYSCQGYRITITPDRMMVFVTRHASEQPPAADELNSALRSCSVVFGLDAEALEHLCAGEVAAEVSHQIAAGQPMEQCRDAVVEYLFDIHPLKAGREGEHDTIDFKDRGDLPQVNPGDILARKVAMSEGRPGKDVHGRTLKPRKPKDLRISAGNGAKLEADGLTLSAQVSGHPAVTSSGVVSVFPEYRIDGDLGYSTGHVNFNGRVIVSGTVQPGFHVKCGELIANEVEGANIEAEGDVLIRGGVIGSQIHAGGNVQGKYFHTTQVEAQGDVVAKTELVDSQVETAGVFHGERCRVLGSRIASRNGIVAMEIGSESSGPCVLSLASDDWVRHKIEWCEAELIRLEEAGHAHTEAIACLKDEYAALEPRIGALAQVQDKAMLQRRELENAVKARQAGAKETLAEVGAEVAAVEQELSALFDQQETITGEIARIETTQQEEDAQMVTLRAELLGLKDWSRDNPGHAEIKVQKTTRQGTVIKTPHQEIQLKENKNLLWLEEREVTSERGETSWQMVHKS